MFLAFFRKDFRKALFADFVTGMLHSIIQKVAFMQALVAWRKIN